jgi:hypothetical protein
MTNPIAPQPDSKGWLRIGKTDKNPAATLTPCPVFTDGPLMAEEAWQYHEGEPEPINSMYAEYVARFGSKWYFIVDGAGGPTDQVEGHDSLFECLRHEWDIEQDNNNRIQEEYRHGLGAE